MDVAGRVCLVTGATKGIGRSVSKFLAKRGARIIAVARHEADLEALKQELLEDGAQAVALVAADVAKLEDLDRIVMAAVHQFGGLDVLVNNAGIGDVKPVEALSDAEVQRTLAVNLQAPILLTQAAVKIMKRRGEGQIIQIGSGLSYVGRPHWSLYAATKFGLRGFNESIRHEVSGSGIKSCLVAPGFTATHFFDDMEGEYDMTDALHPDDVAHAVLAVIEQSKRSDIKEVTVRSPKSP